MAQLQDDVLAAAGNVSPPLVPPPPAPKLQEGADKVLTTGEKVDLRRARVGGASFVLSVVFVGTTLVYNACNKATNWIELAQHAAYTVSVMLFAYALLRAAERLLTPFLDLVRVQEEKARSSGAGSAKAVSRAIEAMKPLLDAIATVNGGPKG